MSGKRKQASSSKAAAEEEKTQAAEAKGSVKPAKGKQAPSAPAPAPAPGKRSKVPSKAEAAEPEDQEDQEDQAAEDEAEDADGAEDDDADMYDEEELAAAAAEQDAFYEDEDGEDGDGSGYDTDEVISFARQSGAIDQAAAKEKKKKDKKKKKAQAEEEEEPAEDFNVDFQFFDPRPEDRYAVKDMLRTFIGSDEKQFNAERLAATICEQVAIGTMVKTEGGTPELLAQISPYPAEQPIGFATILNAHEHKDLEPVAQLRRFLLAKCPEPKKAALQRLFDDTGRQLGLFVHERVINLPSELVPDLHAALFEDLKWAQAEAKKSADPEERKQGQLLDYENLLLVSRCFYEDVLNLPVDDDDDSGSESDEDAKDQPPRKKTKASASSAASSEGPARSLTDGTAFFKYEDEFYEKESALSFRFPMPTPQAVTPSEFLPQVGVACVVHKSKIPGILQTIRDVLKEDYQGDE